MYTLIHASVFCTNKTRLRFYYDATNFYNSIYQFNLVGVCIVHYLEIFIT